MYRLSGAGRAIVGPTHARPTKPYTDRFTLHTLAVSQLAAELVCRTTEGSAQLAAFITEPASWSADGQGGYLKPDAYLQLQSPAVTMHWWVELDLGSESLPTLERKLRGYLDFVGRGRPGPAPVTPRVLITLTTDERLTAVEQLLEGLPAPAQELFLPVRDDQAVATLLEALRE